MKRILITLLAVTLLANLSFSQAAEPGQQAQAGTTDQGAQTAPAQEVKPKIDISLFGSVRYRFQYNSEKAYGTDTANEKTGVSNDTYRERQRIRAVLGGKAKIGDQVELNISLVTGTQDNTRSLNQTLGVINGDPAKGDVTGAFGEYFIGLNTAEIKLNFLSKMITMGFGKFASPLKGAGLVTVGDLRLDGMYQRINAKIGSDMNLGLNLGEFVFIGDSANANGAKKTSRWLLTPQLYFNAKFGSIDFEIAPGMYLWTARTTNYSEEQKFQIFNAYMKFGMKLGSIPFTVKVDFAYNMGKKPASQVNPAGYDLDKKRMALLAELAFGEVKKQWDWEIKLGFWTSQALALMPLIADDDLVTPSKKTASEATDVGSSDVPMAFYVKGGLGLLANTNLNIDFIYFTKSTVGWDKLPTSSKYTSGWLIKMSMEVKF